jgi:repressor LexA
VGWPHTPRGGPPHRDIVIALIGEEATVKYFYKEAGGIRLMPANDRYEPIIAKDIQVLGRVIGLVRSL